jgi:hypothetical protein
MRVCSLLALILAFVPSGTREPTQVAPQLLYGTYLGGRHKDFATAIAVDSLGAAYVASARLRHINSSRPKPSDDQYRGRSPDYARVGANRRDLNFTLIVGELASRRTVASDSSGAIGCGSKVSPRSSGAAPYSDSAVNLYLVPRWQMMGSLEALNGWILFWLTTAFLFAIVQKGWSSRSGPNRILST